jgi:tRNA modification GTPase
MSMITDGVTPGPDDILITNARHYAALVRASQCLQEAVEGAAMGVGPEFLALDIRLALSALGEMTGELTADDVLQHIFSRFCVGK